MPPTAGGEGMTGNRPTGWPTVHTGRWRTRPPTTQHHRSRRDDHAPLGIGVKAKPAARVDLRSSLDTHPSPAIVRTQPGTPTNRSQSVRRQGL